MSKREAPPEHGASMRAQRLHQHRRRGGRPDASRYKKPAVLAWAVIVTLALLLTLYLVGAVA